MVIIGFTRYFHGKKIVNENLHKAIVIIDKDCGSSRHKNRLYFYNGSLKQHLTVKNDDCDQVHIGDTISALYDRHYDLFFYKEVDFITDIYGTIGFIIVGIILIGNLLFNFKIPW
jgi:hypothetical protein